MRADKVRRVSTVSEIQDLRALIEDAIDHSVATFTEILGSRSGIQAFTMMRFEPIGCDPLNFKRRLNLFEQMNQTFTYLASLEAAQWLLQKHLESAPFILNLGTAKGSDIESEDGQIVAEVFAAVAPNNNRKLAKDIARAAKTAKERAARHGYVFFACPAKPVAPSFHDVEGIRVTVVPLPLPYPSCGHN
jgi:hypothetical protein